MPRTFIDFGDVQEETEGFFNKLGLAVAALFNGQHYSSDPSSAKLGYASHYVDIPAPDIRLPSVNHTGNGTTTPITSIKAATPADTSWTKVKEKDICELKRTEKRYWILNGVDHDLKLNAKVKALDVPDGNRTANTQREAVFILGGPGTGKSSALEFVKKDKTFKPRVSNYVYVNTDDIMEQQPGYKELIDGLGSLDDLPMTDQGAAHKYHDAAKEMTKVMLAEIMDKELNLVFDGTGKNKRKLKKRIDALKSKGYRITAIHTVLSADKAVDRAKTRSVTNGRYVPPDIIREANPGTDTKAIHDQLLTAGVDHANIVLLDTTGWTPKRLLTE